MKTIHFSLEFLLWPQMIMLKNIVDDLGELARHQSLRVRSDATHFLALTHSDNAIPYLKQLTADKDNEVREIAGDALNYE